jgi:hypothetical protein
MESVLNGGRHKEGRKRSILSLLRGGRQNEEKKDGKYCRCRGVK